MRDDVPVPEAAKAARVAGRQRKRGADIHDEQMHTFIFPVHGDFHHCVAMIVFRDKGGSYILHILDSIPCDDRNKRITVQVQRYLTIFWQTRNNQVFMRMGARLWCVPRQTGLQCGLHASNNIWRAVLWASGALPATLEEDFRQISPATQEWHRLLNDAHDYWIGHRQWFTTAAAAKHAAEEVDYTQVWQERGLSLIHISEPTRPY